MKLVYILILFATINYSNAFAVDPAEVHLLPAEAKTLSQKCNLEARNSLIHGDLKLVEQLCMGAVKEIEKSSSDKELVINPLLNLAYSYTLAGYYDKATPLYERAKKIGEAIYEPNSFKLKKINDVISSHEEIVRMQKKK